VVRVVEPSGFTKVSALGVEEQRVWVIVAFTSPAAQWQRLGDAYRVEARFVLWEAADVLQIPAGSLFRDGGEWAAFVIEDGRAVKRRVKIGQRNGTVAELLDGAKEGEQVIAPDPDDRLREGVRVETR
jgi:HlyD family secretion protein